MIPLITGLGFANCEIVNAGSGLSAAAVGVGKVDQVPAVAPWVGPDRDAAVGFDAGRAFEVASGGCDAGVVGVEIKSFEEEPDATAALLTDGLALTVVGGAGQQDIGVGPRRCDADPSFVAAKVGVFDEVKADGGEKGDGLIVVGHEEGEEGDAVGQLRARAVKVCLRGHCGARLGKTYIISAPSERSVKTRM